MREKSINETRKIKPKIAKHKTKAPRGKNTFQNIFLLLKLKCRKTIQKKRRRKRKKRKTT